MSDPSTMSPGQKAAENKGGDNKGLRLVPSKEKLWSEEKDSRGLVTCLLTGDGTLTSLVLVYLVRR